MYKVHLDQFQGPLDLLLYFIRRDKIDIYDIPIADITAQYLQTLEDLKSLNITLAGEFVVMAATLMRVKSKLLLPRPELDDEGAPIDPRSELVRQLLDYQRFKEAAEGLSFLGHEQSYHHPRSAVFNLEDEPEDPGQYFKKVTLFDLATYFKTALDRTPVISAYELHREPVSLDDRKALIHSSFDGDGRLTFSRLLEHCQDKLEIIITFLAILDLIRLNEISIFQNILFEDMEIQQMDMN